MPATPEEYRAWIGITRDLLLAVVGTFMLIYETTFALNPNPWLIGAGLAALGGGAAVRSFLGGKI